MPSPRTAAGVHAGFCPPDAQPWLPVAEDHHRVNVTAEQHDPRSVLALYRRLLALRRGNHALTGGAYRTVRAAGVMAHLREADGGRAPVSAPEDLLFAPTHRELARTLRPGARAAVGLSAQSLGPVTAGRPRGHARHAR